MVALPNIPLKISMFPNTPNWSDYSHSEHSHQSLMETSLDLHFPPTKQPLELTDFIGSLCNSNHLTIFKLTLKGSTWAGILSWKTGIVGPLFLLDSSVLEKALNPRFSFQHSHRWIIPVRPEVTKCGWEPQYKCEGITTQTSRIREEVQRTCIREMMWFGACYWCRNNHFYQPNSSSWK